MRIVCVGYRKWALNIYNSLALNIDHQFLIISSKEEYDEDVIRGFKPDFILFYGWSWFVGGNLLHDFRCLMLHPSPLPKYRGGSPIQNQIIAGEKDSKVSIFLMNSETDSGDIVAQEDLSLDGRLSEIFSRIENIGIRLTSQIFISPFNPMPQDHINVTYCTRRNPEDSEITTKELNEQTLEYFYNKIRMLEDPYPSAFINLGNFRFEFTHASYNTDNLISGIKITRRKNQK